jgi:hypothetical protein
MAFFVAGGLFVSAGCAATGDVGDAEEETAEAAEALTLLPINGGLRLYAGACNNDGYVVKNGRVYRLGVDVGRDLTGITSPDRSAKPVCHNTTSWSNLSAYVCNANQTYGNFSGNVASVTEYVDGLPVVHPALTPSTDALYLGHADVFTPCGDPSKKDYGLDHVECCQSAATP